MKRTVKLKLPKIASFFVYEVLISLRCAKYLSRTHQQFTIFILKWVHSGNMRKHAARQRRIFVELYIERIFRLCYTTNCKAPHRFIFVYEVRSIMNSFFNECTSRTLMKTTCKGWYTLAVNVFSSLASQRGQSCTHSLERLFVFLADELMDQRCEMCIIDYN